MNLVQPIRDAALIAEIKDYLKKRNERNYILFLFGINTGMRISDILQLRVKDVEGWNVFLREGKTKKLKEIRMPPELKKEVRNYVKGKPKHEYLFKSRNGKNKPITRGMAYVILQEVADEFGMERIGTHSFRKTYGYHHYKQFKDVAVLQQMLNHSEPKVTLRYIGITQDNLNAYQSKYRI